LLLRNSLLLAPALLGVLWAQEKPAGGQVDLQLILNRLDALEQENQKLIQEIHSLREALIESRAASNSAPAATQAAPQASQAVPQASLEDRVAVAEQRIREQAQTKVESANKFPLKLTGMLLFNAFMNSGSPDNVQSAVYQDLLSGPNRSGATLRQTLLGLQFDGPTVAGAKVRGDLMMDFFSGYSAPGASWLRIRRGTMSLDWGNRSFVVGQDKPLIAPREPHSLAEVGVPPLADAGNLWTWLPQARYEERIHLGTSDGINAQVALLQTNESYAHLDEEYVSSLEKSRPAFEGRLAYWHKWSDTSRMELGAGFHKSTSHVLGTSVGSRLVSLDWLIIPTPKLQISGTYFGGQNFAGIGGLPQSFRIDNDISAFPVHGSGGWLEFSSPLTERLTLNLFGGRQDNRARDLLDGDVARNISYAGNLIYRLGPNVLVSMEALQKRTRLLPGADQIHNRYDLALGYSF
jgi:hypothetical protein